MKRAILLTFFLIALVVAGCGGTSSATLSSDDAAVVGSQQITKDQFQSLMDRAQSSYAAQKKPFPSRGARKYNQRRAGGAPSTNQQAESDKEGAWRGIRSPDAKPNAPPEKW